MAFPVPGTIVTSEQITDSTTHVISLPVSPPIGDKVQICFGIDGNPTRDWATTHSDWDEVDSITGAGGTNISADVFEREVTALNQSDTSITITSGNAQISHAFAYPVSGADAATVSEGANSGVVSTATPDPPSLNPVGWDVEDTLWLCFLVIKRDAAAINSQPANFGAFTELDSGGLNGLTSAVCFRELAAASEDPGTWSITPTRQTIAPTVAIRPAAAVQAGAFSAGAGMTAAFGAVVNAQASISAGIGAGEAGQAQAAAVGAVTAGITQTAVLEALAQAAAALVSGLNAGEAWVGEAIAQANITAGLSEGAVFVGDTAGFTGAFTASTANSENFLAAVAAIAALTGAWTLGDAFAGVTQTFASISAGVGLGATFNVGDTIGFMTGAISIVAAVSGLVSVNPSNSGRISVARVVAGLLSTRPRALGSPAVKPSTMGNLRVDE